MAAWDAMVGSCRRGTSEPLTEYSGDSADGLATPRALRCAQTRPMTMLHVATWCVVLQHVALRCNMGLSTKRSTGCGTLGQRGELRRDHHKIERKGLSARELQRQPNGHKRPSHSCTESSQYTNRRTGEAAVRQLALSVVLLAASHPSSVSGWCAALWLPIALPQHCIALHCTAAIGIGIGIRSPHLREPPPVDFALFAEVSLQRKPVAGTACNSAIGGAESVQADGCCMIQIVQRVATSAAIHSRVQ